jgi:hypothetical protein
MRGKNTNASDPNIYRCTVHNKNVTGNLTKEERFTPETMIVGAKRLIDAEDEKIKSEAQ